MEASDATSTVIEANRQRASWASQHRIRRWHDEKGQKERERDIPCNVGGLHAGESMRWARFQRGSLHGLGALGGGHNVTDGVVEECRCNGGRATWLPEPVRDRLQEADHGRACFRVFGAGLYLLG